jgi:Ser/Thr protein kinase RdoA (MazF antagonist)
MYSPRCNEDGQPTPVGMNEKVFHRVAREAVLRWPFQVTHIATLKVRENAVFALYLSDGSKAVLRIHRPGYHSDEEIVSEARWMEALRGHHIATPELISSRQGNALELIDLGGELGCWQVDACQWIDGEHLDAASCMQQSAGVIDPVFEAIGETAAKLHNHSSSWILPKRFHRFAWDADGLAGEHPVWGRFWDLEFLSVRQRVLFRELRTRMYSQLRSLNKGPQIYSLIHGDLVAENILVSGHRRTVIDFDDCGFGWHVFDLATPLFQVRREDRYREACDSLVLGYSRWRALTPVQMSDLPLFLAARGASYLGWLHSRKGGAIEQVLRRQVIDCAAYVADEYLSSLQ